MIDAILWDNDGVLVDTEGLYFRATRETLARAGAKLSREQFIDFSLRRGQNVWEVLLPKLAPADIAALRRERYLLFSELLGVEPSVIPGALEAVRATRARFRMAVVTSSHREHFDLAHRHSGMTEMFETIVAREDYRDSKPDPAPYLTALARLGLAAERCIAIEDSERGLAAAIAAGVRCVVIPNELTRAGDFRQAAAILDSIAEVPAALARLAT
jgi:HAD superfamily hydrolase (TIGR01509 family)